MVFKLYENNINIFFAYNEYRVVAMANLIHTIQIYSFVKERPHLAKLKNFEKIIEFVKEFHLGDLNNFVLKNNFDLICSLKANEVCNIDLSQAPRFEDRDSLIKWFYSHLKN